jgi:hypothetical protein
MQFVKLYSCIRRKIFSQSPKREGLSSTMSGSFCPLRTILEAFQRYMRLVFAKKALFFYATKKSV